MTDAFWEIALMILFSLVWENNERKDEGEKTPYLDCKIMLGKPLA